MSSTASRALTLFLLVASAVAMLRPNGWTARAFDLALAPLRALTEVAAPLSLLRARSVRAAERRVADLLEIESDARRELGDEQQRFVLPRRAELLRGRSFVIAEVTGRSPKDVDRLEIRVFPGPDARVAHLAPGMPVIVGDTFVGRVHDVSRDGSHARVDLVTRRDGFVGGVQSEPDAPAVQFVVGGLAHSRDGSKALLLALRVPSSRRLREGARVQVDESFAGPAPYAGLADGFALGTLHPLEGPREERAFAVQPTLDLFSGIFQVAVVLPAREDGRANAVEAGRGDVLLDRAWSSARVLCAGDPSALRLGAKLSVGLRAGLEAGAAVVAGARFLGRVERVRPFDSDAVFLGDPECTVPVVARVEGLDEPLILGTLVGLGRARGGQRVRLHWDKGWPTSFAEDEGEGLPLVVQAKLFTGAGASGVPPGLVIGEALLPRRNGPLVLEVDLGLDPRDVHRVAVRLPESALVSERGRP